MNPSNLVDLADFCDRTNVNAVDCLTVSYHFPLDQYSGQYNERNSLRMQQTQTLQHRNGSQYEKTRILCRH